MEVQGAKTQGKAAALHARDVHRQRQLQVYVQLRKMRFGKTVSQHLCTSRGRTQAKTA